jgi:hypothetical protein
MVERADRIQTTLTFRFVAQVPLALPGQHRCEPLAPILWQHRQPVKAPTPAIPRGDQRTGQYVLELSDQQRLRVRRAAARLTRRESR